MDEAMLKSGQYPNVAIMAGTDPAEVMREHGQVIQNGEKYELADADPAEVMREHGLEGCGGWVEYCMQHGDSLGEALLHADEICRAERAESIARIAKQEVDKQADSRDHSKTECSHSNVSKNFSDTREKLEADMRKFVDEHADIAYGSNDIDTLLIVAYEMLDRQAAITERELCGRCSPYATAKDYLDTIDSLTAERDDLRRITEELKKRNGELLESRAHWIYQAVSVYRRFYPHNRCAVPADVCSMVIAKIDELEAERDKLEKELKHERAEWESERDYANQCEERAKELTAELDACRMRERAAEDYDFRAAAERWEQAYEDKCGEVVRLTEERDQLDRDLTAEHALVVQFEHDNEVLTAKRDELEMRVNNLVAELGDAEGSANILERQRDELKAEFKTANDTINTLRASVAGLKGTVEKLRAR